MVAAARKRLSRLSADRFAVPAVTCAFGGDDLTDVCVILFPIGLLMPLDQKIRLVASVPIPRDRVFDAASRDLRFL
jgi:hypothetical protein